MERTRTVPDDFPLGFKTRNDVGPLVIISDQVAEVLRDWLRRREQLTFPGGSCYLFPNKQGKPLTGSGITQMLFNLGNCAGYGPKFFSQHYSMIR